MPASRLPLIVPSDASGVAAAIGVLKRGEVAALPTDTLYALVACVEYPDAIDRIFEMKRRGRGVVLPVLCASLDQADGIAVITGAARRVAERFWPGPVTLVCPRRAGFVADLGVESSTVGVRVPDHPVPREAAAAVGPLASSSANLHGHEEPGGAVEIAALFEDALGVVVAGSRPATGVGSTVVRCAADGGLVEVLRRGAVTADQLGLAPE